jgi:GAF domain-containing protein
MGLLQHVIAELLMATGAGRAILVLSDSDGTSSIAAEAVSHGLRQLRDADPPTDPLSLVRKAGEPFHVDGRLTGYVAIEPAPEADHWNGREREAFATAREKIIAVLQARGRQPLAATAEDVRAGAVQAMLDRLRTTLSVQRCTYRQDVMESYAFPVTYESRDSSVRRLLGDFTIVQTGQPVIEKLLKGKAQVVQEDCRSASAEPFFHAMLQHYGDMRAQIVTPLIRDDRLEGVLSVHELRAPRQWTRDEMALARDTCRLVGQLFTVALG